MSLMPGCKSRPLIFIFGFFCSFAFAENSEPWPEILTLEYSLEQSSADHPQLQMATASVDKARAGELLVDSSTGIETRISARLRWIDPPDIAYDQSQEDHALSLFINKRLYDFGYTKSLREAAEAGVLDREYYYKYATNQHRIAIMAAYFDVLLADLTNARDAEEVKITFLQADRVENRNELGTASDIELFEARTVYQASRTRLHQSSALQRTTRANLANVLNRPDKLPSELSMPDLKGNNRDIPESVDSWLVEAERQNPHLLALKAKVVSMQKQLASARNITSPVLSSEIELSNYAREMGGYDHWRAGVNLDVPISTSGRKKAVVADKSADLFKVKAELEQQRRQIRQEVLEAWSDLNSLTIEKDRVKAEVDFRDLYLDRSRALYQLEVKTDFGDAMMRLRDAQLMRMKNQFSIALAWARIEALLGKKVYDGDSLNPSVSQEKAP